MPKDRYCRKCAKWFAMTRTVWCPLCHNQTEPAKREDAEAPR